MDHLTTGEVAARAGVNLDTVRYYERRGLLPEPQRTPAGYRQYDAGHVTHIRFIRRAQALGFTLEEIGELLALRAVPGAGPEVRTKTAEKVREIDARIHDLQRIRAKLLELADSCDKHGSARHCRVLDALEDEAGSDVSGSWDANG